MPAKAFTRHLMGRNARIIAGSLTATAACLLTTVGVLVNPPSAAAYATSCRISVNGIDVSQASTPSSAIAISADEPFVVEGEADAPLENITVSILVGPVPISTQSQPAPGSESTWSVPFSVSEYAAWGAGYYQVVGNLDACRFDVWVLIRSTTPITVAGLVGLGAAAAGVVTGGAGLAAAARRTGGLARSVTGGALAGGGVLVVAQQLGVVPADTGNIVSWTLVPGGAAGGLHMLVGAIATRRRESSRHESLSDLAVEFPTAYAPPDMAAPPPGYAPPDMAAPAPTLSPPPGDDAAPDVAAAPAGYTHAEPPPGDDAAPDVAAAPAGYTHAEPPAPPPPVAPTSSTRRRTRGRSPSPAAGQPAPGVPASEASSGAAPPSVERAPPRESYAHIACPEAVVAEEQFELIVGLAAQPDREVVGGPLVLPDRIVGPYTMTIQVIADGFRLTRPNESWRVDLRVTADAPYPTSVLHLAAEPQTRPVVAATVRAMFSVEGQAVGLAARPIAVVKEASLLATTEPPAAVEPVDIMLPTDDVPPDLTVRVEVGQPAGRLLLQLLAANPQIHVPTDPLVVDIGNEPGLFLRDIIRKMNSAEGQPGMYRVLMGIGLTIADQLPTEFWDVVGAVAAPLGGRPPTILFLSAEPYVPWELAVMDKPLDPSLPPFLAAQASVGRWVLGQRRPKLPPPAQITVRSIAVVSGVYNLPGWDRLVDAEQEADELAATYGAAKVNAASQDVLRLVSGDPPAELLHFAVHGQYDPNGEIDGIVLVDGLTLDPMQIRGSPLSARPFVFLNACQVGSGEEVLGDYAGMAEAFLFAGASGVIAPLWSIDDITARELALRFYKKALAGQPPADILREERAAFRDEPTLISSTYLAYQYFGHPHMTIARPGA